MTYITVSTPHENCLDLTLIICNSLGRSETIAELEDEANNVWSVKGFKWFSSATTADMTMLLARTVDPKTGTVNPGSKGLSLYLAELRKDDGTLNGVRVHRLKDKYGTKALPTAELELVDMKAALMGKPHRGVPNITAILNITRIYSVAGTLAGVSSSLAIAKDFARKREVGINCSLTAYRFFLYLHNFILLHRLLEKHFLCNHFMLKPWFSWN